MAGPASRWASSGPLTFAPDDMTALKEIVLNAELRRAERGGRYIFVPDMPERYMADPWRARNCCAP